MQLSKKHNMVYVGKTERNFLIRWIEHFNGAHHYRDKPIRFHLYLNKWIKFIILKKMEGPEYQSEDFYRAEDEVCEFYVKKAGDTIKS